MSTYRGLNLPLHQRTTLGKDPILPRVQSSNKNPMPKTLHVPLKRAALDDAHKSRDIVAQIQRPSEPGWHLTKQGVDLRKGRSPGSDVNAHIPVNTRVYVTAQEGPHMKIDYPKGGWIQQSAVVETPVGSKYLQTYDFDDNSTYAWDMKANTDTKVWKIFHVGSNGQFAMNGVKPDAIILEVNGIRIDDGNVVALRKVVENGQKCKLTIDLITAEESAGKSESSRPDMNKPTAYRSNRALAGRGSQVGFYTALLEHFNGVWADAQGARLKVQDELVLWPDGFQGYFHPLNRKEVEVQCGSDTYFGVVKGNKILYNNGKFIWTRVSDETVAHIKPPKRVGNYGTVDIAFEDGNKEKWFVFVSFNKPITSWVVEKMRPNGQWAKRGVQLGWRIAAVNNIPCVHGNKEAIMDYMKYGKPCIVTFDTGSGSDPVRNQQHELSYDLDHNTHSDYYPHDRYHSNHPSNDHHNQTNFNNFDSAADSGDNSNTQWQSFTDPNNGQGWMINHSTGERITRDYYDQMMKKFQFNVEKKVLQQMQQMSDELKQMRKEKRELERRMQEFKSEKDITSARLRQVDVMNQQLQHLDTDLLAQKATLDDLKHNKSNLQKTYVLELERRNDELREKLTRLRRQSTTLRRNFSPYNYLVQPREQYTFSNFDPREKGYDRHHHSSPNRSYTFPNRRVQQEFHESKAHQKKHLYAPGRKSSRSELMAQIDRQFHDQQEEVKRMREDWENRLILMETNIKMNEKNINEVAAAVPESHVQSNAQPIKAFPAPPQHAQHNHQGDPDDLHTYKVTIVEPGLDRATPQSDEDYGYNDVPSPHFHSTVHNYPHYRKPNRIPKLANPQLVRIPTHLTNTANGTLRETTNQPLQVPLTAPTRHSSSLPKPPKPPKPPPLERLDADRRVSFPQLLQRPQSMHSVKKAFTYPTPPALYRSHPNTARVKQRLPENEVEPSTRSRLAFTSQDPYQASQYTSSKHSGPRSRGESPPPRRALRRNEMPDHRNHLHLPGKSRVSKQLMPRFHRFQQPQEVLEELDTMFINASTCTFHYRPTNPPIMFYIKGKRGDSDILPKSAVKEDSQREMKDEKLPVFQQEDASKSLDN